MPPTNVRAVCNSLDDDQGTGGRSKVARLLGWHSTTLWRKFNGKSAITHSDELAILKAMESLGIPTMPYAPSEP